MATRREKERRGERTVSARKRMDSNVTGTDYGSIAIPQGMKLFKPKQAGVKRIEVVPFLTGKGNPVEKEEGVPYFERTYWVHRGIGPDNGAYCCLRRTFGKACPVCDHRASLMRKQDDENEDLIRELAPKQRQLFLVMDHGEWDTGMQLWDVSCHLFGKYLDKKIQDADEEDDYHLFADLKKGKTLKIGIDEKSSPYGNLLEFSNIEFKERSKDLDAGLLEEAPCLDEILKELSYKELKAILLQLDPEDAGDEGDGESDGEEKEKEKRSVKKDSGKKGGKKDAGATADDLGIEVGSTVEHPEFGECEVIHVSGDGTALRIQDADGDVHRAITPADVTLSGGGGGGGDEDEEEEEKPKGGKAGKKPAAKKKKDEEDEDEDDPLDDEEDEDEDKDEDEDDEDEDDEDKEDDEDPDDEDEDEDEKPTRRGRAPAKPTKPAKPGGKPRGRK